MKRRLLVLAAMLAFLQMQAQETWSLRRCIDYALDNNIQVLTKELSRQSAEASLEQSKAQLYPTLSFSSSFGANFKNISTYNEYMEKAGGASVTNSFGLNSGMTFYQGGALRNSVLQQQVQNEAAGYDVEQSRMDIEMSVDQAYIQILYDKENLDLKKLAAELSASQVERGEALRQAGSISKVDLAQLKSQKASDEYQIVSAENQLSSDILKLKQLLELGLDEDFQPYYPEVSTLQIESEIPTIRQIYEYASEANQLSGGQMQRVAIARALVNDPVIILADEATGNLDTRTSYEVLALFQRLHREGKTIIFVTHNPELAQFSTRTITLRDGRIVSDVNNDNLLSAEEVLAAMPKEED